ncbi:MAG: hydroxyacylglutathione hydrolase [Kofleriaceae bacterium]
MKISPVPCLRDNFAYLVHAPGGEVAVVDPGEAAPVLAALAAAGAQLHQVWATHHHPDHVGGLRGLLDAFPGLEVVAHRRDAERVRAFGRVTRVVEDGDVVELGALRATIVHNPGHTLGAISYYLAPPDAPAAVFTGDTLFGAGCGRIFEGDGPMLHASLCKLAALPEATQVYFGHEYTRANLRFAEAVAPGDAAVAARRDALERLLAAGAPSTPSTIGLERATNPFLRCDDPAVVAAVGRRGATAGGAAGVFTALRRWKDEF